MNPKEIKKDKNLKASPSKTEQTEKPKELSEEALEDISGGKVSMQDFHFVMRNNSASPK